MPQQIVKVVVKGRLLGSVETRNVHYYGADTTTPSATEGTALEGKVGAAYSALAASLCDVYNIYGLDSYFWNVNWWQPLHSTTVNYTGSDASDMASFQTAALCVFKTAVKKCLGKKFIAGIPEDKMTDGSLVAPMVATLVTFIGAIMNAEVIGGVSWYAGVPSKNSVFAPFISGTVGTILSTMRRRKPGYGI